MFFTQGAQARLARLPEICLYGDAVKLIEDAIWLANQPSLRVCSSALIRRGMLPKADALQLKLDSLPQMLLQAFPDQSATLLVNLQATSELARCEALELALAALSFDFKVRLRIGVQALSGFFPLADGRGQPHVAGFKSLQLFGIAALEVERGDSSDDLLASLPFAWVDSSRGETTEGLLELQF